MNNNKAISKADSIDRKILRDSVIVYFLPNLLTPPLPPDMYSTIPPGRLSSEAGRIHCTKDDGAMKINKSKPT